MAPALFLASGGLSVAAGEEVPASAGALEEGRLLLATATDGFFDQSIDSEGLRGLLEHSRSTFGRVEDPCLRLYWLAEVECLLGFVEQADKRLGRAERRFEQGRDPILEPLGLGETSDAYRLLADTNAQLLILNSLLLRMSHGPKVPEMAEETLRLDPGNVKARLALALFYKNATAIARGSRSRRLQLLRQLEGEHNLERVERFSLNTWLQGMLAELCS